MDIHGRDQMLFQKIADLPDDGRGQGPRGQDWAPFLGAESQKLREGLESLGKDKDRHLDRADRLESGEASFGAESSEETGFAFAYDLNPARTDVVVVPSERESGLLHPSVCDLIGQALLAAQLDELQPRKLLAQQFPDENGGGAVFGQVTPTSMGAVG